MLGASRQRGMGAGSFGLLGLGRPVGSDVDCKRIVGLGALSLRPMGVRKRSMVLGPRSDKPLCLFSCSGCFLLDRRSGGVGAARTARSVRVAILRLESATSLSCINRCYQRCDATEELRELQCAGRGDRRRCKRVARIDWPRPVQHRRSKRDCKVARCARSVVDCRSASACSAPRRRARSD